MVAKDCFGGRMLDGTARIAVAGAGSIGCYAGGCLALAGRAVTLLARPRIVDAVRRHELSIADFGAGEPKLVPSRARGDDRSGRGLRWRGPRPGDGQERRYTRHGAAHRPARAAGCHGGQPPEWNRECRALCGNCFRPAQRVVAGMVAFNVVQSETPDGCGRFGARPMAGSSSKPEYRAWSTS